MLSKKAKVFVLVGMVALLVLTGCLNIFLNKKSTNADSNQITYADSFAAFKAEKKATREEIMLYYESIIKGATSAEAKAAAEMNQVKLAESIELEMVLEGLIQALGFENAIVTCTTENVNIIVKAPELNVNERTQITAIVSRETNKSAQKIRIIPVE